MPQLILTPEQARILEDASEPVEILNTEGRVLARVLSPTDQAMVAEARRRLATPGPRYSSEQVRAHLLKLEEISHREELNPTRVKEIMARLRAGEEV